ncbi:hypothetical protein WUBG_14077, partial [Wuchereria bancrofti]
SESNVCDTVYKSWFAGNVGETVCKSCSRRKWAEFQMCFQLLEIERVPVNTSANTVSSDVSRR